MSATGAPRIEWNGSEWFVALPLGDGKTAEANVKPTVTYVCRIRESGSGEWSAGFETPLPCCVFTGLKPDTEYELQVSAKSASGEGTPTCTRLRTDPEGRSGNVIPFPDPAAR